MPCYRQHASPTRQSGYTLVVDRHIHQAYSRDANWPALGKFLVRRRRELGYPNIEHLRQDARRLPPGKPSRGTLRNVEMGLAIDFDTFLYLPELYRVSYDDLFALLWPEHATRRRKAESLVASLPWLDEMVERLVEAPVPVRECAARVLDYRRSEAAEAV